MRLQPVDTTLDTKAACGLPIQQTGEQIVEMLNLSMAVVTEELGWRNPVVKENTLIVLIIHGNMT